ncbi:HlyD family type I secretion periplasmic adaptor subunit [Methylobacter sp.]|uniref:HlyD family type I secretion periplasmic adaptor subunit n=1 Tax=Methylobacter sp. TaxID=2051955 RepID=UPI002488AB51|nr:HlyD family type I secretion periplasmic adaptor subunit [Methylobacter sp.]MDI1278993.1 HlyD family type I secretion periplasmic adaptor subunit [Methylobacter sp.]MDI1359783.1 HlyD family type I secretion periplasmic adaptor subunit [Methylobacter sp.]
MEPADQSFVSPVAKTPAAAKDSIVIEFLPDADEIELRPLPRLARITLHVMLAALISFLMWASFSELDRVVVARGRLVTPLSNILVQPLETSIIQSIDVRIGQLVKKGERLATLDPTFAEADEEQLKKQLSSLETQSKSLAAELVGNKTPSGVNTDADSQLQAELSVERHASYQAQLAKIDENVARLQATLATNRHDQQMLTEHVKPLQEIEAMQEKLVARNFGARVRLLEAQEKRQEVERNLQLAKNREQEIRRELAGMEAEEIAFKKGWRQKMMEEMLSTSRDRNTVSEQLQKADKRHKLVVLTSSSDAVVLDIAKLSVGSVVQSGGAFFTLVPLGAELEAEVQIDAMDVGYVKLGDTARVKLDAYPFQRHGILNGEVRTVSEDAFRKEAESGQAMDAFYKSRVNLGNSHLKKMPERSRLLPGMTLTAEIVVGKRSVISYLLWPLTKGLDESMEEP